MIILRGEEFWMQDGNMLREVRIVSRTDHESGTLYDVETVDFPEAEFMHKEIQGVSESDLLPDYDAAIARCEKRAEEWDKIAERLQEERERIESRDEEAEERWRDDHYADIEADARMREDKAA